MLYFLFDPAAAGSVTTTVLRSGLAAVTALVVALLFGSWLVRFQRRRRFLERTERGDSVRLDELHRGKSDTPTMGGIIFIVAMSAATLIWGRLDSRFVWLLLGASVSLGLLGFVDDCVKFAGRRRGGLPGRVRFVVQLLLGAALGTYLYLSPITTDPALGSALVVPLLKAVLPIGILFIPFAALVVAATSNAVNLTDGLDGLAIGCTILAGIPFAVIAVISGHAGTATSLGSLHIPGSLEVSVFASSLVGAGCGFLWFNRHPARIFMGDTGALALGGALATMAILTKKEFFLGVVGGVFVVETLSVILQVASFKLRGRRVLLIAPLHHHFQFKGWTETKVTGRFWMAGAILAVLSIMSLGIW